MPTLVVLAELDTVMDITKPIAIFEARRAGGALWAVAVEPGVPHHSLTPAHHRMTIEWLRAIAALRLPADGSGTLQELDETTGWLGDRGSGEAAPWATFAGDRARASWMPSEAAAESWQALVGRGHR